MNKLAIALSAALSLGAAASAHAAEATISFTGEISSTTCEVKIRGAAGNNLTLRTIGVSAMELGDSARSTPFTLTVGADADDERCPAGTTRLYFSGANIDSTGALKNTTATDDDGAANVELALVHDDKVLDLATDSPKAEVTASGVATYAMQARYRKAGVDAPVAGSFTTSVGVDVTHE